jgi:hypothetical protein
MPAPLRNILFILRFRFILEVGPDVCPLSMIYHFYPFVISYGPSCKYLIIFIPMLDAYTLPSFEKYK